MRFRQHRAVVLPGLCVCVCILIGCNEVKPPELDLLLPSSGNNVLHSVHDMGKVLAGEKLSHPFTFTNTTEEVLVTDEMSGVRKSCQCAGAAISRRRLAPNETSEVEVRVDTTGRVGKFSEKVSVTWSRESGRKLFSVFELRGASHMVFEVSPDLVDFTRDDVIAGEQVEVIVRSDGPRVDWATFSAKPPVDYLEISRVAPSENGVSFLLGTNKHKVGAGGIHEVAIRADAFTTEISENNDPTTYSGHLVVHTTNPGILKIKGRSILLSHSLEEPALFVGSFSLEGDFPDTLVLEDAIRITVDASHGFSAVGIATERLAKTVVRVSLSLRQALPSSIDVSRVPVTISVRGHLEKEMSLLLPRSAAFQGKG